jgi:lipoate---protein ligase
MRIAMSKPFRVIDTGLRPTRLNIAFDQAMIEAHKAGRIADTIRFLRFPQSALIGRHQALSQELRLDHCRANGIEVARRITGGGAIVMGPGILGWELVFARATLGIDSLADLARRICEAAAHGLSKLGVDARFRPRNDIEVDGRKISGTGGFFDGDTLFYQGTVLVDFDPSQMVAALNVPQEKLAKRALDSAAQRVVTLKELLGDRVPSLDQVQAALVAGLAERLDLAPAAGVASAHEEAEASRIHDEEIGTDAFVAAIDPPATAPDLVSAARTGPGGTVRAYLRLEGAHGARIREALITGDFFVTPPRIVYDLEASLRSVKVDEAAAAVDRFFAGAKIGLLTITPADFRQVVVEAIESRTAEPS